jgi:hypothetical protein
MKNKNINQIVQESDDSDSESDYESDYRTAFAIRNSINKVQADHKFQIDTGADEHVANNDHQLINIREYDPKKPPVKLYAANNEIMPVVKSGTLPNTYIKDPIYVTPTMGTANLLSGPKLQKQGWWIICPPTKDQTELGCILTDGKGQIMATTDHTLTLDPNNIQTTNRHIDVDLLINSLKKNFSYVHSCSDNSKRIRNLKGYSGSRADLVHIVHSIGHWSKQDMIWMARNNNIIGFPLTEAEIRTHYRPCDCCQRGEFRRDPTNHWDFKRPNEGGARNDKNIDKHNQRSCQIRNSEIGYEVGIDIYTYGNTRS